MTSYTQEISDTPEILEVEEIPYVALTLDQAEEWLRSIPMEHLLKYVIVWDYIEHSQLNIPTPMYSLLILENGDVQLVPVYDNGLDYDIADIGGILEYVVTWPTYTYENVIIDKKDEKSFVEVIFPYAVGVSLIGGFVLGVYVAK